MISTTNAASPEYITQSPTSVNFDRKIEITSKVELTISMQETILVLERIIVLLPSLDVLNDFL